MSEQHRRLSTADEIAEMLSTSRRMVYYFVKKGMPHKRFSERVVRFDLDEVMRWAERNAEARN